MGEKGAVLAFMGCLGGWWVEGRGGAYSSSDMPGMMVASLLKSKGSDWRGLVDVDRLVE
jgi:hypothetical protein